MVPGLIKQLQCVNGSRQSRRMVPPRHPPLEKRRPRPHCGAMTSFPDDYLLRPDPADPRLTERVRGIDQTGAPVETAVTGERALNIFLNAQQIGTAMTIKDS